MARTAPLEMLHRFGVSGAGVRMERIAQGYINDTFRVHVPGGDGFILQRINGSVFPDPEGIMENLERVLPVLRGPGYRGLSLQQTPDGKLSAKDAGGSLWRLFHYLPGSGSYTTAESAHMAREAGRIIGTFHTLVLGIPAGALKVTLPRFHDIHSRYAGLMEALSAAPSGRKEKAAPFLEAAERLFRSCRDIPFSKLPLRVCHNDTKLSNILFDTRTSEALCLIDLDTLMPGHLLYDFGDAVRTVLFREAEGEKAGPGRAVDFELFEAFVSGWKDSGLFMEPAEAACLARGAVLMPALHGIRALTDYLSGDRYYKVEYADQNLDRAGRLLSAAGSARAEMQRMQECVEKLWP